MVETKTPLPMAQGGSLEKTPLAEILRGIYRTRLTAKLLVASRGEERTFWFDRGQLIGSSSNREAQLVGELLRTFGLADENLLLSAFENALQDPGRGLSRALAESGAVPSYVADAAVRALAERILFDTFRWTSGLYTVTPLEKPPALPASLDRTTGSLVLEALRRFPPARPQQGLSGEMHLKPALTPDLILRYQLVTLTGEEAEALGRVDGVKRAEDVSPDPRVLSRLAAAGLIHFPVPGRDPEAFPGPNGLPALNAEIAGAPPPPRAAEVMESQANLVWNTYRRLDWITLYAVAGTEPTASLNDVHRGLHERARLFHPDNAFRPHLSNARDALEALFQKLKVAEKTFRSEGTRSDYDRALSGGDAVHLPGSEPTPEVQRQIARANYTRARLLYDQEDYYPAYEMVRQAVEFDPQEKDYWILLSRIQRKNPKWVRHSTETMRRAVQNIPNNVELWYELSEACVAERNEAERIRALREVLKLDPGNRRAQAALMAIGSKGAPA